MKYVKRIMNSLLKKNKDIIIQYNRMEDDYIENFKDHHIIQLDVLYQDGKLKRDISNINKNQYVFLQHLYRKVGDDIHSIRVYMEV